MIKRKLSIAFFSLLAIFMCSCGNEEGKTSNNTIPSTSSTPSTTISTTIPTATKDPNLKYDIIGGEVIINDKELTSSNQINNNNRVFYQIFVGSFSDSNNDRIGDIRGIINRLDYLNDGDPNSGKSLGIQGIWLSPIFSSPTYHKYDVKNYYKIDIDFGTQQDLEELIQKCHERNIKIILDLPINHTSIQNEWFTNFKNAVINGDTTNPYYDFYTKVTKDEKVSGSKYSGLNSEYSYECNFDTAMPELNFDSENVKAEVLNIAKYWLDLGVDGFRFDAAKYIYFGNETKSAEFWDWYLTELRSYKSDIYTVGEVWSADGITDIYYEHGLSCFNFSTSGAEGKIASAAKQGNVTTYTKYVENYLTKIKTFGDHAIMHQFISNHDMDRAAGYLTTSFRYAQVGANLYLLSPGSPFIYYGEEIGIKGSRGSDNTDANRRLAMRWGDGDRVGNPTGATYKESYQINGTVATQIGDENSLLNHYKKLIMIRNSCPEIINGEYKALSSPVTTIGGFISTYNDSKVCVIHNTSIEPQTISLSDLKANEFNYIFAYSGYDGCTLIDGELTIQPQTSVVLRIK